MGPSEKDRLRLLADLRELFPELLFILGSVEQMNPSPSLSARIGSVRARVAALLERSRTLEEASDCMPAADQGRMLNRR